jgi:HSP20 family protein
MKNEFLYDSGCLVYPGAYVPLVKEAEVKSALRHSHESEGGLPPVNITELSDLFKIEVAIPGVNREDFHLYSDGNVLSVCVLHKASGLNKGERFQLHEFNYECFDRHIILPDNVDAEFAIAEYKSGILCLHIPKTTHPAKNRHTQIVVY